MKKILLFLLFFCSFHIVSGQNNSKLANKLVQAYPSTIKEYSNSYIIFNNGNKILFDDGKHNKNTEELLNKPSLLDMMNCNYAAGTVSDPKTSPGRIRSEDFMKQMYGRTSVEVQKNLTTITWCPRLVNIKLKVTTINGVDKQLQKISDELDKYPELQKYLSEATTFNWRIIKGTNRLSTHSFGTAIDLNIRYSNYWQWDCRCTNEDAQLKYKNQIPQKIVDVFEKYGFIWGGKWYHYDTMHFEYRPELL